MPSAIVVAETIFALIAVFAGYIYLVGIPPELKRELEKKALKTMGENKASYMFKNQLDVVPDGPGSGEVKNGLGRLGGEALKNPLGEAVGEGGDEASRPLTGR